MRARSHAVRGRLRAFRSRAGERGSAIFVVVLVLAILTAIGAFAARAAGLNQRLSGYSRQSTQTTYIAEYGSLMVFNELTGPSGQAFIDQMQSSGEQCYSTSRVDAGVPVPCYKLNHVEIQNMLNSDGLNAALLDPNGESLGDQANPLHSNFSVEMTELVQTDPLAGDDQTGLSHAGSFVEMTFTSSAQLRPLPATGNPNLCTTPDEQAAAQLGGTRAVRMIVETRKN